MVEEFLEELDVDYFSSSTGCCAIPTSTDDICSAFFSENVLLSILLELCLHIER